jgi:hypothetical protein
MQQLQLIILGFVTLLIALIVALICVIVVRDRRELKTKQIAADLSKAEELAKELAKIRGELMPALSGLRKHTDAALSQIEGQLKQLHATLSGWEHKQPAAIAAGERQEDRRDRGSKQPAKSKGWGGNRPERGDRGDRGVREGGDRGDRGDSGYRGDKRKEFRNEGITINDGERYAKVVELAANGLTAQEIAKKLNVEQDEVDLVLELKGKK